MATTLTKNTKMPASYHQWAASDITNGDILGVWESLGNRCAHTVTIEAIGGGDTIIRFNVSNKIYQEYRARDNHVGMGMGALRPNPTLIGEVEIVTDNITIEEGSTQIWESSEIAVKDIKVINKSANLKITIT